MARTALIALRRDRGAMVLSFVLPLAFFTIFAVIFGGENNTTPKVTLIVVDQDKSEGSENLIRALEHEGSLWVHRSPVTEKGVRTGPDYTAATAEAAVKAGDAPVALIIPAGFGQHPIAFGPDAGGKHSGAAERPERRDRSADCGGAAAEGGDDFNALGDGG